MGVLAQSCGIQQHAEGKQLADTIIENFDQASVVEYFPETKFPREQMDLVVKDLRENCAWEDRDGKYVDFYHMKKVGEYDLMSYIYEYYLDCDSLRFILTVDVAGEPEMHHFNMEPLERENFMIVDPSKQLINRQ